MSWRYALISFWVNSAKRLVNQIFEVPSVYLSDHEHLRPHFSCIITSMLLTGYFTGRNGVKNVQEIWVSTTEAAEITGYNADYLQQIARKVWKQAEDERPFKIRNRSRRYEFWLPDLLVYLKEHGNGPQRKRTKNT